MGAYELTILALVSIVAEFYAAVRIWHVVRWHRDKRRKKRLDKPGHPNALALAMRDKRRAMNEAQIAWEKEYAELFHKRARRVAGEPVYVIESTLAGTRSTTRVSYPYDYFEGCLCGDCKHKRLLRGRLSDRGGQNGSNL